MNKEKLAALLQSLKAEKGMTTDEIHDVTGLLPSQVEVVLQGGGTAISLVKVLNALGCNIADLAKPKETKAIEVRIKEMEEKMTLLLPLVHGKFHSLNEAISHES
jgi:hypothetical protein